MTTYSFDAIVEIGTYDWDTENYSRDEVYADQISLVTDTSSTTFSYTIGETYTDQGTGFSANTITLNDIGIPYFIGNSTEGGSLLGADYIDAEVLSVNWGAEKSTSVLNLFVGWDEPDTRSTEEVSITIVIGGDALPPINSETNFEDFFNSITSVVADMPVGLQEGDDISITSIANGTISEDDTFYGTEGGDVVGLGQGNDTFWGDAGNDTIRGGRGDDEIYGNAGNDTIDGRAGWDTLYGGRGNDNLVGGTGQDTLYGAQGKDRLDGGAGSDVLFGGNHADVLLGGGGADELFGGNGNDVLKGHKGNDSLDGGRGDDTLTGGGGADSFVFDRSVNEGSDTITDFDITEDLLYITSDIPFAGTGVSNFVDDGEDTIITLESGTIITLSGVTGHVESDFFDLN
ncbi:calcium-binding protein [Celeribacter sp.]|uniref:calcium-binding protein n=1 Tax=Celeribacter sp. TaxID=1890673 RepID=UPI003A8DEEA0